MILSFAPGSRRTIVIGLEPEEARSILRGGTVETGNDELQVLVGRAAEIVTALQDGSERTGMRVTWLKV